MFTHPVIRTLVEFATFRRLWIGALISALGDNLAWLVMSWFVLDRGGSGQMVGWVLLAFALPAAATATAIGGLMDRYSPRRIMLIDNAARAAIFAAIPVLHWLGVLSWTLLIILAACAGALAPASNIGLRQMVTQLLPRDARDAGNAAMSITQQVPLVAGPLVGGWIVAVLGAADGLWINGLSFLALCVALIGVPDARRDAATTNPDTGRSAWLLPFRYPAIAAILLMNFVFFAAYGPMEVAFPIHARESLRIGPEIYGALWAVFGVGALIGSALAPKLARMPRRGLLLGMLMLGYGLAQLLLSLATTPAALSLAMFLGGVSWGPFLALETGLIQQIVPVNLHGRLFGARSAWLTPATPLGTALGGLALGALSAQQLMMASALVIAAAACLALGLPALRSARAAG